jgi:hypothetical protein
LFYWFKKTLKNKWGGIYEFSQRSHCERMRSQHKISKIILAKTSEFLKQEFMDWRLGFG